MKLKSRFGRLCHWVAAALAVIVFAISAVSCGGEGGAEQAAVPRRVAYPRLSLPKAEYDTVPFYGHSLIFNRSAVVETELAENGNHWFTATYPDMDGSQLMVTAIKIAPEAIAPILDNRAERINLNLSGNPGEVFELDDSILSGQVIVSRSISTPIQFLATDNRSLVVSGALYMPKLSAHTRDSLAPTIDYVFNDVVAMLENLSRQ